LKSWLKIALRKETRISSLKIAAIVGTLLFFINYGDSFLTYCLKLNELITGNVSMQNLIGIDFDKRQLLKIFLAYMVPYCVSTYTKVESFKQHQNTE